MMHAFRSSDGGEDFAYIPKAVIPKLANLANSAYSHQFFVNSTANIKDAYINGWKTILVASTGAGGRGVFALNVSHEIFTENDVLWEFNSENDSDLGYTIGTPQIGITPNGKWVAVFGNGYDSKSKEAILFVLSLESGQIIQKYIQENLLYQMVWPHRAL